ncbi:Glucanosyltransferase-domain-containing protein [Protomyces lactucae-debilis]|uniref:1,3-beta-glucanosyltransferase n=1 Tax=Protomyces lactucae-debilis TaxID=2754530 RepID=A0A1Y2FUD6_PROLT|nr:Glucanosyltransferase-domain-containing protein [Protomyces lactucae-debilis]ORY87631.1 Glucanosyltransferase-domain-containing protein [Protomyces lactucae-debilis]
MRASIILASLCALASAAISPLQINGTKFFTSNDGKQFYFKGVAYQPLSASGQLRNEQTGSTIDDPLANPAGCAQDVKFLTDLGANAIRVYRVNATLNHDECMQTFADAGIYLILDLETPDTTVKSDSPTWTVAQYNDFIVNLDAFRKYPNTAAFFIGNEVVDTANRTVAAPFVKAAARDMRAYQQSTSGRYIPIGYATADVKDLQIQLAEYLSCGKPSDGIDFYGLNVYRWCGQSSYTQSGYDVIESQYKALGRPFILSETGCNIPVGQTRTFGELEPVYGIMADVVSGAIIYEYNQEDNMYGLVTTASVGATPTPLPDYAVLKKQWQSISPPITMLSDYQAPGTSTIACPPATSGFVAATNLPPTPDSAFCACAVKNAKCSTGGTLADKDIAKAFGTVCGLNGGTACSVVTANGSSPGTYGDYSFCSGQQQLALVYNNYYALQKSASDACGFPGATLVGSPANAKCTHAPLAALAQSGSASGSGGSSSAGGSTTSSGAKSASISDVRPLGLLSVGLGAVIMAVSLFVVA